MTPERWRHITAIFHAALARDGTEREALVALRCGDDSGLRREVAAMLAAHEEAGGFGENPVFAAAATLDAGSSMRSVVLRSGTHVGPYEVVSALGVGGMGAVYRARDKRLHRDVALKVLLPVVADDPDRLARFRREARALAALNHPNIAQVHGLEEADGSQALVLELVDGTTLADRIARGAIPLDEALPIAKQIAEALEAAHEHGIIHRDLKPANIKVRQDGAVKVLDFGLAKLVDQEEGIPNPTQESSPSSWGRASPGETVIGTILGSVAYMPPEQAQGKPVDRRADIWALGCVLFEMLAGRPPFEGETAGDVVVRIIEHEPEWDALPVKTPAAIRRLLHRCLEKHPKWRLDSAAVARIEMEEAAREPTRVALAAGARPGSRWRPIGWAATGAGVVVLVTIMPLGRPRPSEIPPPMVATSVLVDRLLSLGSPGVHFAVAPSGRTVVFAANYGGRRVLYRRDLDRVDPEPIIGTDGGSDVFISHDGRFLGFETRSELWTAPLDGGTPQRLLPNQPLRGGTWGEGDRIIVGRVGSGLWMASTSGGEPRQLTAPRQGERHELPQMLPGGRAVLFTILAPDKPPRVAAHLLGTGETRALFEGMSARFVSSGHVVFGRQGRLWAVGFDAASLRTLGAARPVRDDVLWSAAGYPQFAVNAGLLAYVRTSQATSKLGNGVMTWVDREGRQQVLPLGASNFHLPRLSPTGNRLVVQIGASRDLWTYDMVRGTLTPLTSDRIIAFSAPAWTADGGRVAFTTWFDGEVGLGWLPPDGRGPVEVLVKGVGMRSFERTHPVMLPDGSGVILTGLSPGASVEDLLLVRLDREKRLETLFHAAGVERNAAIAPNGRFIAYNSDESGRSEVYVRPFPNVGARKWQVSPDGGVSPVWTRHGRELVYIDAEGRMMAVAVRSDRARFDLSPPQPLFKVPGDCRCEGLDRGWDVTADGERFLFVVTDGVAAEKQTAVELTLIQNWGDELKRLAPREPQ